MSKQGRDNKLTNNEEIETLLKHEIVSLKKDIGNIEKRVINL